MQNLAPVYVYNYIVINFLFAEFLLEHGSFSDLDFGVLLMSATDDNIKFFLRGIVQITMFHIVGTLPHKPVTGTFFNDARQVFTKLLEVLISNRFHNFT